MISTNKTYRESFRILASLILTVVLVATLLIKPAHILLIHHDLLETTSNQTDQKTSINLHHHDCAICDFEFCSFIPQKQAVIPQVNIVYIEELASRTVACFVSSTSQLFQLRAPPAA
jgi:hypothetical protein